MPTHPTHTTRTTHPHMSTLPPPSTHSLDLRNPSAQGLKMGVFYEMENYFDFGCQYVLGKSARSCGRDEDYVKNVMLPEMCGNCI